MVEGSVIKCFAVVLRSFAVLLSALFTRYQQKEINGARAILGD